MKNFSKLKIQFIMRKHVHRNQLFFTLDYSTLRRHLFYVFSRNLYIHVDISHIDVVRAICFIISGQDLDGCFFFDFRHKWKKRILSLNGDESMFKNFKFYSNLVRIYDVRRFVRLQRYVQNNTTTKREKIKIVSKFNKYR